MDLKSVDEALDSFGEQKGEFIRLTLNDACRFMEEIHKALKQGNTNDVWLTAHSLKSILKQAGDKTVSQIAFDLERAGKAKNLLLCTQLVPALDLHFLELKKYLESKP